MSPNPDRPDRGNTPPELIALGEIIKIWVPGLRSDPMVVAGQIKLQLYKRGFVLTALSKASPSPIAEGVGE